MDYNLSQSRIEYNTTNEYRRMIRSIFGMDTDVIMQNLEKQYDTTNMDEETLDELLYDSDKMDNTLSILFDKTIHDSTFVILYEKAAGLMLSTDKTIGQCVLFSYDYFSLFHVCLCDYFVNHVFDETCDSFIQLHCKLSR
jgi:hypothetical protein